jgi:hypothetical protein
MRLHCPFKVRCIEPVAIYPAETVLQVEKVNLLPEDQIYYSIYGKPYSIFVVRDSRCLKLSEAFVYQIKKHLQDKTRKCFIFNAPEAGLEPATL